MKNHQETPEELVFGAILRESIRICFAPRQAYGMNDEANQLENVSGFYPCHLSYSLNSRTTGLFVADIILTLTI